MNTNSSKKKDTTSKNMLKALLVSVHLAIFTILGLIIIAHFI